MKLTDIITQAQMLAGIGDWTGNATDMNMMSTCLAIFHQTLNNINNDPKITLWQEEWDYQQDNDKTDLDKLFMYLATEQGLILMTENGLALTNEFTDTSEDILANSKFPDYDLPFPVSLSYPFPKDCRRVNRCITYNTNLRKVDYSDVATARRLPQMFNVFAVNNRKIELVVPQPIRIVYAKEFPRFMPQDEVTLPDESLSYVIAYTAYNIALTFNRGGVDKCQVMMQQAYEILISNLTVNQGENYLNPMLAMSRFDDFSAGTFW